MKILRKFKNGFLILTTLRRIAGLLWKHCGRLVLFDFDGDSHLGMDSREGGEELFAGELFESLRWEGEEWLVAMGECLTGEEKSNWTGEFDWGFVGCFVGVTGCGSMI